MLKDCPQQVLVIEDQITGLFVGEQFDQALCGPDLWAEHAQDEVDVFRSELHSAVGLNDVHNYLLTQSSFFRVALRLAYFNLKSNFSNCWGLPVCVGEFSPWWCDLDPELHGCLPQQC